MKIEEKLSNYINDLDLEKIVNDYITDHCYFKSRDIAKKIIFDFLNITRKNQSLLLVINQHQTSLSAKIRFILSRKIDNKIIIKHDKITYKRILNVGVE